MKAKFSYTFKVDPQTFRKALYFNTFSKQRFQIVLVAAMWIIGISLLVANVLFGVEMSTVMQLCYTVLIISMPLLVFSCESGYRRYRDAESSDKLRHISISDEWLKFSVSGDPSSEKIEWRLLSWAFELSDIFILYRDTNLMILLPKSVMKDSEVTELRELMYQKLGRAFQERKKSIFF